MTSRPPPSGPGLFNLELVAENEPGRSKIKVRADSQEEHLGHNYISLSSAARNLLAVLSYYGNDKTRAEKEFKVTLVGDPGNLNAMHSLVYVYRESARAELADDMERRLAAALQRPLPLALAQCLAEQAYALSFECFSRDSLAMCQVSTAWLEQAMRLAGEEADQEPQADSGDQGASQKWTTLAEWRLCMIWNLKKAFHRSHDEKTKQGILLKTLNIIWELLGVKESYNTPIVLCYLGFFLWKCSVFKRDNVFKEEIRGLARERGWEQLLQNPGLCFEQALKQKGLDAASRNEVKMLFGDYLSAVRQDESTIQQLSAWLEEATKEQCLLTMSHLLDGRAWTRTSFVKRNWRSMPHHDKLRGLNESVEDLKLACQYRPGNPHTCGSLAAAYNTLASVYKSGENSPLRRKYANLAIDVLIKELQTPDGPNHPFLYRELHKAHAQIGLVSKEAVFWQKRWLEREEPGRSADVLEALLTQLSAADRTESHSATSAASAAFWLDYACAKLGDDEDDKVRQILINFAKHQPGFAREVCACVEDMRSSGELGPRDGSMLKDLRGMMGLQAGHVDSHVRQALALDRSEFSPPEELSPRNVEGVTWDVGVVCAPEDVTWFRRGVWRYLVREFDMKVKILPPEGDLTPHSGDVRKVLVVMSASFWPWAERGGHVTWLRELTWRDGAGLVREDAPPPPHLADLAILRRTVTPGDWSALLQALW